MSLNGPGEDSTDARRGDGQESEASFSASGPMDVDAKPNSRSFRYSLNYPSMGQCIIINNKNFDRRTGMNQRNGTDVDAGNAMKVFTKLGYKTKIYNDQTVEQMKQVLISVSKEDHSCNASFICVLLSHGDEGVFFGTDGSVELKYLTSLFRGNHCPVLFVCILIRLTVEKMALLRSLWRLTSCYYSWRNTTTGSWFIQSLCDLISKYGKELELQHIMTRVNHKVAVEFESISNSPGFNAKKQIPCIVSMLTKEMYFSP
uniref:Caspase-3 n=1 Tax=Dicentrarchus labrax TaxID=13489 RepID=A0A8C4IAY5_DICLA